MKKFSIIILISSFFLTACGLGFPRMSVNYDRLPKGEIRGYITKIFPNKSKKEELGKIASPHLNDDNSSESIQNIVLNMSMTCVVGKEFCEHSGYIRSRATEGHSRIGRVKHIHRIVVSLKKGLDSLDVEKQIVGDIEKGD